MPPDYRSDISKSGYSRFRLFVSIDVQRRNRRKRAVQRLHGGRTPLSIFAFDRLLPALCRLAGVCRRYGTWTTLRLAVNELTFDRCHGTSTAIESVLERSGTGTKAPVYESSNPLLLRRLLAELPTSAKTRTFLDYGAGKGRAIIVAAAAGFERCIGIENQQCFFQTALRNLLICAPRYPKSKMQVFRGNAAHFRVPDDVGVAYFYNPFGAEIMQSVVVRIANSLARNPRDFYIVYMNPRLVDLFLGAGFRVMGRPVADGFILHRPAEPSALPGSGRSPPTG